MSLFAVLIRISQLNHHRFSYNDWYKNPEGVTCCSDKIATVAQAANLIAQRKSNRAAIESGPLPERRRELAQKSPECRGG